MYVYPRVHMGYTHTPHTTDRGRATAPADAAVDTPRRGRRAFETTTMMTSTTMTVLTTRRDGDVARGRCGGGARRRATAVVVYAGKGKRKGQRRAEDASSELVLGGGGGGARQTSGSLAGALGPISIAHMPDGADAVEFFLLAKKRDDDEDDAASRWLPLGDVVFDARTTNVDDVVRERYWILRDFARKRHLSLNVGNKHLRVGVRAQKGPKHPRATTAVDVVEVCDERTAFAWDAASGKGEYGTHHAILRLFNTAPSVTAATKAAMLKQSAQYASAQDNAIAASELAT